MIDIPEGAMDAMRNGVWPYRMFLLELGGTSYRTTTAPDPVVWQGHTWTTNDPIESVGSVGSAPQNGTLEIVMDDLDSTWQTRFEILGESGKTVELHYLIPYGDPVQYWTRIAFVGKTVRAEPVRPESPDDTRGKRLALECADQCALPGKVREEWATNEYQRELAAALGLQDDSHVIATAAYRLEWFRV